jgi:ABC-type transport system involved in multi-copper enzyme maturation permease subunit
MPRAIDASTPRRPTHPATVIRTAGSAIAWGMLALGGGLASAEGLAWLGGSGLGVVVQAVMAAVSAWWVWRGFATATHWRVAATGIALAVAAATTSWYLARQGWSVPATGLAGVTGMALGCGLGLAVIRRLLSGSTGIAGVARTVVDEAVRMRASLALVVLLVLLIPTLPLVLDPAERLAYRLQFVLSWALGGTGIILSVLTIVLACGTICGDIDSGRIHMTLAKPVQRWEYLLGKWLGIVLFDLLLVGLACVGTVTFVRALASMPAVDDADRVAVDDQVLAARVALQPEHDRPEEYEAAIAEAIRQLERDDPEGFAKNSTVARRRIRQEQDWQWHTVSPEMVSTFVFRGLSGVDRSGPPLQLQLKPRAFNVGVDLADVRFVLWLNGRPWPMRDGAHVEQTLATQALHVLSIPADVVDDEGVLRLTVGNRNLVPPGETHATAITFPPGDGLRLLHREGGFIGNVVRCLAVIWSKLAMVAAVGVAASTCLGLPMAVLLSLVVYATALGSGFLRDALGIYNMSATTAVEAVAQRLAATAGLLAEWRLYEAVRMLLGFVTDLVLWMTPAFGDYDAVGSLAEGIAITDATVWSCLWKIGIVFPLLLGIGGWLIFERRDPVRSST